MFEGMPWPLVLPIAIAAMAYGIMISKRELKENENAQAPKDEI